MMEDDQGQSDRVTQYFQMKILPPLAHKHSEYNLIVERDCYCKVDDAILNRAKECLKNKYDTTIHVSGIPVIGKRRFYLYCIFRLNHLDSISLTVPLTRSRK